MINLKIDNYKCPKCGKETTVAHRVFVAKLKECEFVVDGNNDPVCNTPMFSSGLMKCMERWDKYIDFYVQCYKIWILWNLIGGLFIFCEI